MAQAAHSEERPLRVLILAFGCNPYAGSESEAGWAMVETISQIAETVTLVRCDHKREIERYLSEFTKKGRDVSRMRFVEVPTSTLALKLASLFVNTDRRAWYLTYFSFLRRAGKIAERLVAEEHFDVAVHAAYGCYWLPTSLIKLQIPVVWGPVGGATKTPFSLYRYLGLRGILDEIQKLFFLRLFSLLPQTRKTWYRAAVRLVETENTRRALPKKLQGKTEVVNRGLLSFVPVEVAQESCRESFLLFPSRLEPRKGARLALEALSLTKRRPRLIFAADGPEKKALQRLAARKGVSELVEFRGFVPRPELFRLMRKASAVIFCGLREEGGMALAESMILGAPVIVLGVGGARLIAESNSDPSRVAIIEPAGALETARRFAEEMDKAIANPSSRTDCYLVREKAVKAIWNAVFEAAQKRKQFSPALSWHHHA